MCLWKWQYWLFILSIPGSKCSLFAAGLHLVPLWGEIINPRRLHYELSCHIRNVCMPRGARNLTSPVPVKWQSFPTVYRLPKVSLQFWPLIRLSAALAAWATLLYAISCQLLHLPMFAEWNHSKCWSQPMMSLFNRPRSTSTDPSASVCLQMKKGGRERETNVHFYITL